MKPFAEACFSGNPDCLVALNDGWHTELERDWQAENMTAGEFIDFTEIPKGRYIDGAQAHILAPLGVGDDGIGWCNSIGLKRSKEYMADYVKKCNEKGCLVSIDVGIDEFGHIAPHHLEVLEYIKDHT